MKAAERLRWCVVLASLAMACGGGDDTTPTDGAMDARDAGGDAQPDAADDAQPDAVDDVGEDVGEDTTDADPVTDAARDDAEDASDVGDVGDVSDVSDAGDANVADAGDASVVDAGDGAVPSTVAVGHAREFRAVWVASVSNINFPSRTGLSATAAQAELTAMLDVVKRNRLNAVVFQVRPEGDALYRSTIEPWSRFLTGRQGGDPGFDPLYFLVGEAHRRGIEVHAWFNPYRAKSSASSTAVAPHISVTNPEAVVTYGSAVWMDPSRTVVQERLINVIRDVVTRYDIDGVHFDDYFYPYPITGTAFPDASQFSAYTSGGGTLSLADWRRDNVNRMVQRVSQTVADTRASVRFGISPFGIYRPGMPAGITGLDAYNAIYCDPVRWMREGWLDYVAPQLYWPSTQTAQAYGALIAWWAGLATNGRSVFAGNNLGQLGSSSAWTVDEFRRQVELTRAQSSRGARGNIWFTVQPFQSNRMGIADVFRANYYTADVLTPPMAGARPRPPTPSVTASARVLRPTHPDALLLRAWAVYRLDGSAWTLDQVQPATQTSLTVSAAGTYAVSAVNRFGDESLGATVVVR